MRTDTGVCFVSDHPFFTNFSTNISGNARSTSVRSSGTRFAMDAKAALETVGDGEFPLDLSRQDRVFLLGENRFEDRKVDA